MAENTNQANREDQEKEALRRREERRRRRKRNQMLAYIATFIFVLLAAAGVVSGVMYIGKLEQERKADHEVVSENIDNMIEAEETIVKPETEPQETVTELTPEEKLDEIIDAAIEVMPLEDKVAGLFVVTPESITGVSTAVQAGDGTKEALSKWAVGGLIYFEKNMRSAEQMTEMIANSSLYSRYPLFICVEEEGGSMSPVAEAGLAENAGSAQTIGATADPSQALAAGTAIGEYLSALGFNVNFAPVADISNTEGSIAGEGAYGSDSSVVASMVISMVQGLEEKGVSACLKHFPGIGSSVEDPEDGLAVTERTAEQFRAEEFSVFSAGIEAGADFIMVSNVAVPAFTGDNTPCTLSKEVVTDILRSELGFDGVIITDAMDMTAVTEYYGADEAAILALRAGCDMILMPDDFETAYNGVLEAVQDGTISEERINDSLRRIYRIKYADKLAE